MSEVIQSKDDKEYAARQCWGRCLSNSWQIEAAGNMIRDITDSEDEERETQQLVLCNGLLAANSLLMTGLEELQGLLDLSLPDWNEITKHQPSGIALADTLR